MDSGNIVDKNEELEQPVDAVVADTEENGSPQTIDSDSELFVETEDDQQQTSKTMSNEQQRAAFLEERRKRKKKNEELQKEREANQKLIDELAELKAQVSSVTNPKPKPEDFYNAEDYAQALEKWQGSTQSVKNPSAAPAPRPQADDVKLYELHVSENAKASALPDYNSAKEEFNKFVVKKGLANGDSDLALSEVTRISQECNLDPATVVYVFGKTPALMSELMMAANLSDGGQSLNAVIKKAASKLKTRKKVVIDSQPEPNIKSSGPIDNSSAAVNKAREAWQSADTGKKLAAWNKYQGLKKQNKVNENGK